MLEDHLAAGKALVNSSECEAQPFRRSGLVTGEPIQMGKQAKRVQPNLGGQLVGLVALGSGIVGESLIPRIASADAPQFAVEIRWTKRIDPMANLLNVTDACSLTRSRPDSS